MLRSCDQVGSQSLAVPPAPSTCVFCVQFAMASIAVAQVAPHSPPPAHHGMNNEALAPVISAAQEQPGTDDEADAAAAAGAAASGSASFTPVLSKSAKRRARAKMAEAFRAEEQYAAFSMPLRPPPAAAQRFVTPPPAAHLSVHHSSSGGSMQHSSSPLPDLAEMFPSVDRDVLSAIFQSCGRSFEATVEYMLTNDAAQTREDKHMQAALSASLAAAALDDGSPSSSPPPVAAGGGVDHMSSLSGDLFSLVCESLNLFDLTNLASVSRDARAQVESGSFARMERLDLGRYAAWPDWKLLRMLARFASPTIISFRNSSFKSFSQLGATCFGRRIKQLSFAGCHKLGDADCHALFAMGAGIGEHLQSLDLSQCEGLTDDGLEHIATARHNQALTKLSLSECKHISSLGVQRVLERCGGLRSLDLKGTNVTKSILQFTQQQSQLTELNLSTCRKLSAELSISSAFCQLTSLSLSANPNLKAVSLALPTLTHLNLSNAKHVHSLLLFAPRLQTLNLNGCLLLATIAPLPNHSKALATSLQHLNANLCRSITTLSFHNLLSSARNTLKSVSARGCILLSDANIATMMQLRPHSPSFDAAASSSSSSASASSSSSAPAAAASPVTLLEWLDLSGCKSASASSVLLASRAVAEANAVREASRLAAAAESDHHASDPPGAWAPSLQPQAARPHADAADHDHEQQWSGGLDDEAHGDSE